DSWQHAPDFPPRPHAMPDKEFVLALVDWVEGSSGGRARNPLRRGAQDNARLRLPWRWLWPLRVLRYHGPRNTAFPLAQVAPEAPSLADRWLYRAGEAAR